MSRLRDNKVLLYCIVLYCIVLYCIVLYPIAGCDLRVTGLRFTGTRSNIVDIVLFLHYQCVSSASNVYSQLLMCILSF